jgi:hypothetical protein
MLKDKRVVCPLSIRPSYSKMSPYRWGRKNAVSNVLEKVDAEQMGRRCFQQKES